MTAAANVTPAERLYLMKVANQRGLTVSQLIKRSLRVHGYLPCPGADERRRELADIA